MSNTERKHILLTTSIGHFLVHFSTMVLPAILIILEKEFQVSLIELGTLVTIQFLFMGIGGLPAGILVDRFGSKFILSIYFLGIILFSGVIFYTSSYFMLAIGIGGLGIVTGLYHPAGLKLISHHTSSVSRNMAIHGVFGSIGLAAGPIYGALVSNMFDWRTAYLVLGCISFIGFLTVILTAQHSQDKHREWPSLSVNITRTHIYIFIIAAFWGIAHHGLFIFLPYYFHERVSLGFNIEIEGGILTGFVLLLGILGQLFGGYLGENYSRKKLQIWVVSLNIPFLILMGMTSGISLLIVVSILGAINFMFQPINNSLIADVSQQKGRGLIYGISFCLSFGVGSLAGIIGGAIGDILQTSYIFPAMAIILLPSTFFAWKLKVQKN